MVVKFHECFVQEDLLAVCSSAVEAAFIADVVPCWCG